MQITDLLVPERVALNMQVADKAMAIHAMVGMLDVALQKNKKQIENRTEK